MLPWAALLGTLGLNYSQHKRGRPTLCSTARRFIPGWLMTLLLCAGMGWLVPHYWLGFLKVDLDRLTD